MKESVDLRLSMASGKEKGGTLTQREAIYSTLEEIVDPVDP